MFGVVVLECLYYGPSRTDIVTTGGIVGCYLSAGIDDTGRCKEQIAIISTEKVRLCRVER